MTSKEDKLMDSEAAPSQGTHTRDHSTTDQEKQHSEENQAENENPYGPAPEGGLQAWLCAAGGACLFFCCLGFSNSFGSFEEYYLSHQLQGESPDRIAWIGSLSSFLQFASGMLGGPLFDRYGAWVIRPAAILYVFSMMMLSLCKEYWQFMLVQGILMGVVMGLLQFPAFAAVSQYFDKKRAAALGIVVSGSSIGGIIIPILVSKLLNDTNIGFGWSIRIIGFLIIPFMAFAIVTVKARVPSRTSNFWIASAYKDPVFVTLIVSLFFVFVGMFTPLFYLPTYAVFQGVHAALAGYLLAILNAASTFGRIIPGVLADKYGRLNIYGLGGIVTGIIIFCMSSAKSVGAIVAYAVAFGFASGTIISGASAAFSVCPKDTRDIGTYMGMGMSISALGGLIGPPINGAFVDHYNSFFEVSMFSGAMCTVGGFIALTAKLRSPGGWWAKN
ncbi:major facilitator superfamily protein [Sarocladium implicatum]|nr:major facilitator superfamily protein [Sarocladium implicatum]